MTDDLVILRSQFNGGATTVAVPPGLAAELLRPEREGFFWRDGDTRPANRSDRPKVKAKESTKEKEEEHAHGG